jgi:hypothetical protein
MEIHCFPVNYLTFHHYLQIMDYNALKFKKDEGCYDRKSAQFEILNSFT